MDASAVSALQAYRNQLKMMQDARNPGPAAEETEHSEFAELVGQAIQEATASLRRSDEVQMQALSGKVELSDLVTAVTEAELTLNTVVAVRDRVINAYQDIIRMAI